MSGLGDLFREMEESMDPVRAKRRRVQNKSEDQPGRALRRSDPDREASGYMDMEAIGRRHYREEEKKREEAESERIGDKLLSRVSGKMVKNKPGDPKLTKATFGKVRG